MTKEENAESPMAFSVPATAGRRKAEREVRNAFAEMLRRLTDYRQQTRIEAVLRNCPHDMLQRLARLPDTALGPSVNYRIGERLRDGGEDAEPPPAMACLVPVLNAWCREGGYSAIRAVLGELGDGTLRQLCGIYGLDREVISMTREYSMRNVNRLIE